MIRSFPVWPKQHNARFGGLRAVVAFLVAAELSVDPGGGMLSYLHQVKDGMHLYYFANSSNDRVDTWVRLRGRHTLQRWNPHSGTMAPADGLHGTEAGQEITRARLVLEPVSSVLLTGPVSGAARTEPSIAP